jgi:hypothetical protein
MRSLALTESWSSTATSLGPRKMTFSPSISAKPASVALWTRESANCRPDTGATPSWTPWFVSVVKLIGTPLAESSQTFQKSETFWNASWRSCFSLTGSVGYATRRPRSVNTTRSPVPPAMNFQSLNAARRRLKLPEL